MDRAPPATPDTPRGDSHRFDGVRPLRAICEKCGYRYGGVPVHQNALLCPECGHRTPIALTKPDASRPRLAPVGGLRHGARLVVLAILFLIAAMVLCAALM